MRHAALLSVLGAAAATSTLVAGCAERPVTEVVVISDTDLAVPTQVDAISIAIEPPTGLTSVQRAPLAGEGMISLPATLGVVHRGGPLGPVRVVATALLGDGAVVSREAVLDFVPERTVTLLLPLRASCRDVVCQEGETCADGHCRSVEVTRDELLPFDGTTPRLEAGVPCTSELCNDFDDDCDGAIDEDFDLQTSVENCGACGRACQAHSRGEPLCVDGACGLRCEAGWGDCDGDLRNGCEVSLNTLTMCGVCGEACEIAHGTPTCFTGTCEAMSCAPGWDDCENGASDGCESPLDTPAHCGSCTTPCAPAHATPTCSGGVCRIATCEAGYADCDAMVEGCERPITTITDCGACDAPCPAVAHGTPACTGGRCDVGSCATGWDDCNGDPRDGCETPVTTVGDCGACGAACALPHATETCGATGCAIAACEDGWGDCNATASDGCETSLETQAHCGGCAIACTGTTPLCGVTPTGGRACESSCAPGEMICGGACTDVSVSLTHCGSCDQPCAPPHASAVCAGGTCAIAACDPGFDDCDGLTSTGCETRLDTLTDCGSCAVECSLAGATETCSAGRCQITACEPLRADCDTAPENGCEVAIDTVEHCGSCTNACDVPNAIAMCVAGACAVASCLPGFADCDGIAATGCEVMLGTLADCAACGDACDLAHAEETCTAGQCRVKTCDAEFGDCDGLAATGCETSLRTTTTCGSCTTSCSPLPNASSTCASGTCAFDRCDALWGDCDGMTSTGCEQSLEEVTSCGGCAVECVVGNGGGAEPDCSGGTCHVRCTRTDRLDCNGSVTDGCEARIINDPRNCGSCGNRCASGESCNNGRCVR